MEQAHRVQKALNRRSSILKVKTSGDIHRDKPLGSQDTVGFFTKEIERALLDGRADLAVHSLKDLPVDVADGLELVALMERDEAADVLLVREQAHRPGGLFPVAQGARLGASSLRRQALVKSVRPDVEPVPIRGNVPTRLRKAVEGDVDCLLLSRAGLARLGLDPSPLVAYDLNPARWPGAAGQGVIAVECRRGDERAAEAARRIEHAATRRCTDAERRLLKAYGAGCHVPFGCWARFDGDEFFITVAMGCSDGRFRMGQFSDASPDTAEQRARRWIEAGGPALDRPDSHEEQWLCRPAEPWC